ncbi:MAG: hypothetical protein PHO30_04515 [Candidatus Omnitrophica bacterium]|nr:hypothetical protein [Candidatus Omnitrophota bacterium]
MKPARHSIASFFAGTTIWALTNNKVAGGVCFLSGVLPDVDHVLEYLIHNGMSKFSLFHIYRTFDRHPGVPSSFPFPRLYLFLHSNELAVLLWLAAVYFNDVYVLAASVGYSLHMVMDIRGNKGVPKVFYWFIWRMRYDFDCAAIAGSVKQGRRLRDR